MPTVTAAERAAASREAGQDAATEMLSMGGDATPGPPPEEWGWGGFSVGTLRSKWAMRRACRYSTPRRSCPRNSMASSSDSISFSAMKSKSSPPLILRRGRGAGKGGEGGAELGRLQHVA